MNPTPSLFVLLRQVEGSLWCVVRRRAQGGRQMFDSRIATARPYDEAYRVAVRAGKIEGLRVALQTTAGNMRRLDPARDIQEPRA